MKARSKASVKKLNQLLKWRSVARKVFDVEKSKSWRKTLAGLAVDRKITPNQILASEVFVLAFTRWHCLVDATFSSKKTVVTTPESIFTSNLKFLTQPFGSWAHLLYDKPSTS